MTLAQTAKTKKTGEWMRKHVLDNHMRHLDINNELWSSEGQWKRVPWQVLNFLKAFGG